MLSPSCVFALTAIEAPAQFVESAVAFDAPVSAFFAVSGVADEQGGVLITGRSETDDRQLLALHRLRDDHMLEPAPVLKTALPDRVLFFDAGAFGDGSAILFVEPGGVSRLDISTGDVLPLIDIPSIYRTSPGEQLQQLDFLIDVNDDGRDDIVLPDFDGVRIAIQEDASFRLLDTLELEPRMRVDAGRATYEADPYYWYDFDANGTKDLAVIRDGAFLAYLSADDGTFETRPVRIQIDIELTDGTQSDVLAGLFGADQSDLELTSIAKVADLNRDDLPDIVTFTVLSSGVFKKESEYRVYLADRGPSLVRYGAPSDSVIVSSGFQVDLASVDNRRNGTQDLVSTSVGFGLGQLISALVRRSFSLDIGLHRYSEPDGYSEQADFSSNVRVSIDISTGYVSFPAVRFADFDGDGVSDFLVQQQDGELNVRLGSSDGEGFDKDEIVWSTQLPIDGNRISLFDINGDNKQDIVIGYGRSEGEALERSLRVLISSI